MYLQTWLRAFTLWMEVSEDEACVRDRLTVLYRCLMSVTLLRATSHMQDPKGKTDTT